MPTPRYPSATNLFIPQATGEVVGFIRKPGAFKLMDYVQLVRGTRTDATGWPVVLYVVLDPDAPARRVTDQEYAWEDSDVAPEGAGLMANFTYQEVRMFRRAYPYRLGEQIVETAQAFKVLPVYRSIAIQLAMTNKTARVCSLIDTVANWGTFTSDNNVLNGGKGKWNTATATPADPNYLAIKRAITQAALNVNLNTNSVVQLEDMRLVISPQLAYDGGNSAEITDYLKGSVYSKMVADGIERGANSMYGMPDTYAGIRIIVEDASYVTERPNAAGTAATSNRAFIKDPTKAVLLSRKGGLDGVEGSPSYSTLQIYYYKYEMAVEEQHDTWNKLHNGRVVDQFKEVLAAPRAGWLITNCR